MPKGKARPKKDTSNNDYQIPFENWMAVPNYVADEIVASKEVPHATKSVLLFLFRATVGWNKLSEVQISLSDIEKGAAVARHTAIHSTEVICSCWQIFRKTRGQKGRQYSRYSLAALTVEQLMDRVWLVDDIYGTIFPSPEQLAKLPCTEALLRQARQSYTEKHD